jgi:uncharacterized membrane protein YadS
MTERSKRLSFVVVLAATPWISPPLALLLGLGFGILIAHPWRSFAQKSAALLLQACVVGLGVGMNLHAVAAAGRAGLLYTATSIALVLLLGAALGRGLRVPATCAFLISVGTAICGGSAIAAVGPAVQAKEEEMTVALGTVFMLNAVGLLAFPLVGAAVGLTQTQFGLWAALAIHDTSSVVGATVGYGPEALAVGTLVKLARAFWIVPVTLLTALAKRSGSGTRGPWFLALFLVATAIATFAPQAAPAYAVIAGFAKRGLSVTVFLIGSALSLPTLRAVGLRAFSLGALLWTASAVLSLVLIRAHWIAF